MAKRTPMPVARGLKTGFKKLFSVFTHPTKSRRKADSKTQRLSGQDQDIAGAVVPQDERRQQTDIETPAPLLETILAAPEFPTAVSTQDPQLTEDHASLNDSGDSILDSINREGAPANVPYQPQLEGSSGTPGKSSFDHLESMRADSGAILSLSATNGAAQETCDSEKMPATIHSTQHPEACITIPRRSNLAQQLQTAVLEHRNLKVLEHDADEQLSALEDEATTNAQQIDGLQDVIKHLKSGQTNSEQLAEIDALYDAVSDLRKAEEDNWQRQQRLKRHMSELYQEFRNEQCTMFDNLDTALVEEGLIPPESQSLSANRQQAGHSSAFSSGPRSESCDSPPSQPEKGSAQAEKEQKSLLMNDYLEKRKKLGACELRFDNKENLFDHLEESRMEQMAAGEGVETPTVFDLFLYEETRYMTRALVDAEAEYEVSKAAVVAAGIQLKYSDLESGFVDDVNDGYRVSMEKEMVEDCDRERIEEWLMDMEEKECPTRYLSVRDFEGMDLMVEADESALREVEISDSRSMVAEGPSRKRIDRWESQFC